MPSKKKRLKKGIESLKGRIEEHKIKKEQARIERNYELERYYVREIKAKQETMKRKKEILKKMKR